MSRHRGYHRGAKVHVVRYGPPEINQKTKKLKKRQPVAPTQDLIEAGYTTPGWYFWEETLAHVNGPYKTQVECLRQSSFYFANL